MVDSDRFRELVVGCGLGAFSGDALGMPVEGLSPGMIREIYRGFEEMIPGRLPAGSYTDDTEMMISIVEALVEDRGFNPESVARRFHLNFDPRRGYGGRIHGVMERLKSGVAWNEAGTDSFGNGAAMRIAPVGLFFHRDVERLTGAARDSSLITHHHPEGVAGGAAQALGVALSLRAGIKGKKPDPGKFIGTVAESISGIHEGFALRLQGLTGLKMEDLTRGIRALFRCNVKAIESVPAALACFLYTDSFRDAVVSAVSLGGDTDTIGAMTGALAGAFYGKNEIPEKWLDALEEGPRGKSRLENLLLELAEICPK